MWGVCTDFFLRKLFDMDSSEGSDCCCLAGVTYGFTAEALPLAASKSSSYTSSMLSSIGYSSCCFFFGLSVTSWIDSAIECLLFEIYSLIADIEDTRDCFGIDSCMDYLTPLLLSMDSLIIDYLMLDSFIMDYLMIDSLICDSFSNESCRYSSSTTISSTIEVELF